MNKILSLLLPATLLALSPLASAASIGVDLLINTAAATHDGTLLNTTFTARIGYYNPTSPPAYLTAADIQEDWTQAGQVAFATGTASGYNGYFSTGDFSYPAQLTGQTTGLGGKDVWIWITDGASLNTLITGFGTFAYQDDIPNATTISIWSDNLGDATIIQGSYNPSAPNLYGGGLILMSPVPEPSAVVLGALGALGLLRRRRA